MVTTRGGSARPVAVALALVGLGLALAPVVFGMFHRAPLGAEMIQDFAPLMTKERLAGFQGHLAGIDASVQELDPLVEEQPDIGSPSYATFSKDWPEIHTTMTSLMDQVAANREGYDAVASLPDFRLFPWFFAVPGVIIFLLAGYAAVTGRDGWWLRGPAAAIGVALVVLPFAVGMFHKAPQGAQMMGAFETIETTENVARIQGYFATMASGQGAIRLDIAPELVRAGVPHPATERLDAEWIGILNDMTPMIGAMSDSVDNYQAVASLPSFRLFPWFFVAPGAVLVLISFIPRKARP
ncbi:hypothetical protein ASD81_09750 [Nocardioides sp. Root614]|nr:hypothetical protein ASD81_09750 [Nocardioides sp. Root614]KRA92812.1 hypothetical protein ASD84_10015 [Nocardioides sp. Root682]